MVGQNYYYHDHNKKKFVESEITSKDIQFALKTKGTKFYRGIKGIENPKKLLLLIKKQLKHRIEQGDIGWINRRNIKKTQFSFDYDKDVGDEDLIPTGNLTEDQKKKIKSVPRSEHVGEQSSFINVLSGIEKKPTKVISAEMVKVSELPFYVLTAYPSGPGADSPAEGQVKEEYEYNKNYWDEHVFIL